MRIIKLQGFLFFGTVVKVEASIRNMLDAASWKHMPIRYLILDFSLGSGVDFSAAEAFLRIQRLLESRDVGMIVCGCDSDTPVGKALEQVDLFRAKAENPVHLFDTLNDSLEVSLICRVARLGLTNLSCSTARTASFAVYTPSRSSLFLTMQHQRCRVKPIPSSLVSVSQICSDMRQG